MTPDPDVDPIIAEYTTASDPLSALSAEDLAAVGAYKASHATVRLLEVTARRLGVLIDLMSQDS